MTSLAGLNHDFRDLLLAFVEEGVEFLAIGAYALALHGAPRATGDLDVFVRATQENAARVWRALIAFGASLVAAEVRPEDFATAGMVYQIGLPPRRIDVLTTISGLLFEEAWATRERPVLDGTEIAFIGREAFLQNKLATGRAKDLADVERLQGKPPSPRRNG